MAPTSHTLASPCPSPTPTSLENVPYFQFPSFPRHLLPYILSRLVSLVKALLVSLNPDLGQLPSLHHHPHQDSLTSVISPSTLRPPPVPVSLSSHSSYHRGRPGSGEGWVLLGWGKNRKGFPRTTWEVIPSKQCPFLATLSSSPSVSLSQRNLSHNVGRATTGATPKSSEPHLLPSTARGPERPPGQGERMLALLHIAIQISMATLLRLLANVSLFFAFSVSLTPSLMRILLIFLSTFSHATQRSFPNLPTLLTSSSSSMRSWFPEMMQNRGFQPGRSYGE